VHSPAWALVTFTVGVVSAWAIASTFAFVVALALSVLHGLLQTPSMQRQRARRAAAKQRRMRHAQRERLLDDACVASWELEDLSLTIDQMAELDEDTALDVEPLLDDYVDVARARKRCASALSQADTARLELQLAIARDCHPREAQVLERRIAHSRVLAERLNVLEASASDLAAVIRYYAARASLPDIEPLVEPDAIGIGLAHYDACEAAERVLLDGIAPPRAPGAPMGLDSAVLTAGRRSPPSRSLSLSRGIRVHLRARDCTDRCGSNVRDRRYGSPSADGIGVACRGVDNGDDLPAAAPVA
jgi:hypothetical protein